MNEVQLLIFVIVFVVGFVVGFAGWSKYMDNK